MRVSYKWLLEFIDWNKTPQDLADLLTMSGLKRSGRKADREKIEGVVTAEVIKIMNHPNATI